MRAVSSEPSNLSKLDFCVKGHPTVIEQYFKVIYRLQN